MNALIIGDIAIRQETGGRWSVGDLHRAAGGLKRQRPSVWERDPHTAALLSALRTECIDREIERYAATGSYRSEYGILLGCPRINESIDSSVPFVVIELAYAYAYWIGPVFLRRFREAYEDFLRSPLPSRRVNLREIIYGPRQGASAWGAA